ncbi:uncharacterized protein N7500_000693 [Penicillium coprophilum]|uniref:uncharacterized protein n=1 Tax=Penicillium coprophilum TaxID=36646 RepID=UPI002395A420|nr:uncharacterized protein N7500_000693 [Penicillium coprophilum]KAJ5177994.1 hypothetical protein N7500_000693 [Penicillium coprophilum]
MANDRSASRVPPAVRSLAINNGRRAYAKRTMLSLAELTGGLESSRLLIIGIDSEGILQMNEPVSFVIKMPNGRQKYRADGCYSVCHPGQRHGLSSQRDCAERSRRQNDHSVRI